MWNIKKRQFRIMLSGVARTLMKALAKGDSLRQILSKGLLTAEAIDTAANELQSAGLADYYAVEEDGEVGEAVLTQKGEDYIAGNPRLRNPFDTDVWWWKLLLVVVGAVIGVVGTLLAKPC